MLGLAGLGLLAIAFGFAGASCNKMSLTAPSGSSITLLASTNNLPVNGSTDITAVVIEGSLTAGQNPAVTSGGGTPVANGTVVSFTTTLGHLDPMQAETHDGKAVVKLYADGQSGTATVNAFSGPATGKTTVSIGAAGASKIFVTANPQTVGSNGGTATIVAQVQDAQGNGLLGVPVSFSTSAGTLTATSGLTDNSGNVSTTLTTSAAATVTASAGGAGSALTATVNVTVKPRITLSITAPASITVSVPAQFTIGVASTGTGTPIVNNVVVEYGDGAKDSLGQISANTPVTHLYGQTGQMTVKVTATDQDDQPTVISSPIVVGQLSAVPVANPSTTALGGNIQFTVTVTTGALIDHYEWDFGEGDPVLVTPSNSQGHVYLTKGGHTAVIKIVPVAGPAVIVSVPIVIT
ncbi:MAG TPA: Ig-like domain-containing protein [Vicinamibacterales bacterium]|nr:Ig-like domain-containing protein [Vicinamibacterales bacterium]